jgi:hypothetical protein
VIRGLSASANRQIAAFERVNGLHPGQVAHAFRRWSQFHRRHRLVQPHETVPEDWRAHDCHVRTLLEHAAWALRRKARRELRAVLKPWDDLYEARTVNNPFLLSDLHWWLRRIEL